MEAISALGRAVSRLLPLSVFLLSRHPPQSANSIQGVSGELSTDGETGFMEQMSPWCWSRIINLSLMIRIVAHQCVLFTKLLL